METKVYEQLARLVLPKEILDRCEIASVEVNETLMEMYISSEIENTHISRVKEINFLHERLLKS